MSNEIDDGGLAFPCAGTEGVNHESLGMTLRDYFAAKAMQGMMGLHVADYSEFAARLESDANYLAKLAYHVADTMIKTRSK